MSVFVISSQVAQLAQDALLVVGRDLLRHDPTRCTLPS